MSTIDVANLTDAESTTTNSANSSDNLNNTTTLDTKYITNGSAKSWARYSANDGITGFETLNVTSFTENATGQYTFAITNSFSGGLYCATASPHNGSNRTSTTSGQQVNSIQVRTFEANSALAANCGGSFTALGDLA